MRGFQIRFSFLVYSRLSSHIILQYVPPKPSPAPLPIVAKLDPPKKTEKKTTTEFEVINNPKGKQNEETDEEDEGNDDISNLTPSLDAFSLLELLTVSS